MANGTSLTWASRTFLTDLASDLSHRSGQFLSLSRIRADGGRLAAYATRAVSVSLTNAIRQELASQGTRVGALHVGFMDTDLAKGVDQPKSDPADIARIAVDGIAAGEAEILADAISEQVRAGLASGVKALYPDVA